MAKKTAIITELTSDEVFALCMDWQRAKKTGIGISMRSSFSNKLDNKTMEFVFTDFPSIVYRINSPESLAWSENGVDFKEEYTQILELETTTGLFLINHLRSGTFPLENMTLIVDVETNLVTLINAKLGESKRPRDVERTIHFGYIKNNTTPQFKKHNYTTDLVGKIIDWYYDEENQFVVKHMYVNNEHMVYLLLESHSKERGLVEAAECDYIKIRDDVYVVSWLEKGHQGMQATVLIDLNAMYDVGSFFGISIADTLENYTFAGKGKFSDLGRQIIL